MWFIHFLDLLWARYNCAKFHHSRKCVNKSGRYSFDKNINNTISSLNQNYAILSNWFHKVFIVLNSEECFFIPFGAEDELQRDLKFSNNKIKNRKEEKALKITVNSKLDFSTHPTSITKKANIKLNRFTRVQKYMTPEQKALLMIHWRLLKILKNKQKSPCKSIYILKVYPIP